MSFLEIFPIAGFLIIALLILFKVFALYKSGVSVRAGREKKDAASFLLYLGFFLLLLLWLTGLIIRTFQIPVYRGYIFIFEKQVVTSELSVVGACFIFLSVLLMLLTLLHFKSSFRFGMNKNNQGKLITTGIFSRSRNPFFLSLDLYFIGQALVFPGILFAAIALMAVLGIHLFIMKEEKYLVSHYRNDYLDYMRRVRRYF